MKVEKKIEALKQEISDLREENMRLNSIIEGADLKSFSERRKLVDHTFQELQDTIFQVKERKKEYEKLIREVAVQKKKMEKQLNGIINTAKDKTEKINK